MSTAKQVGRGFRRIQPQREAGTAARDLLLVDMEGMLLVSVSIAHQCVRSCVFSSPVTLCIRVTLAAEHDGAVRTIVRDSKADRCENVAQTGTQCNRPTDCACRLQGNVTPRTVQRDTVDRHSRRVLQQDFSRSQRVANSFFCVQSPFGRQRHKFPQPDHGGKWSILAGTVSANIGAHVPEQISPDGVGGQSPQQKSDLPHTDGGSAMSMKLARLGLIIRARHLPITEDLIKIRRMSFFSVVPQHERTRVSHVLELSV